MFSVRQTTIKEQKPKEDIYKYRNKTQQVSMIMLKKQTTMATKEFISTDSFLPPPQRIVTYDLSGDPKDGDVLCIPPV